MVVLIEMMTIFMFTIIAGMTIASILNFWLTIIFVKVILWFLCMGGIFYGLCSLLNHLFNGNK
jgi:hypothetical protein